MIIVTPAAEQYPDSDKLSPNARSMLELREEVLAEWAERVRQTVKEAGQLPQPILIDTFPALYDAIAEAITPGHPRKGDDESNTVSTEHGGERARLTNYNMHSVISEYQILKGAIFDVLKANGVQLTDREAQLISIYIDDSIRESVKAFNLAQTVLREKFYSALTHDLRNPLSNAYMAAQFIERSSDLPKIKELAGLITANLKRMDGMIQDLLDSAKFQNGERLRLRLEEFDMQRVAKEVCLQFAAMHGPRFELLPQSVTGWWDRESIKRAMENLVGNALKYGADDTPIRMSIETAQGRVIVSVHNEGEPIPSEQIESIFQIFQRAATAREGDKEGWGIGLQYVRSVAESHGGSVAVDSAAPRGTTFIIDIPVDARPFQDAPTL
jgi:signal transduction histidine kinase